MANKIGAKIVLEGEAEYRKALKNINAEQKELRSEMKLATSEFGKQQDSVEALTKKQDILSKQYQVQADKVDIYTKAVEESGKKQDEAAEKVSQLKTALAKASEEYDAMASNTKISNEVLDAQQKIVEELRQKLSLAEDGYRKAQNSTANWKTSLNNAQVELNNLNSEVEENRDALRQAQLSTEDNTESIKEMGTEIENASEKTSVFGDVLKANLASDIIREGVNAIVDGIKTVSQSTVTLGSSFESSMSQVAATMGMTAQEIAEGSKDYETLKTAAEECGAATKYSASQAAEALNYLALAGYDATKSAEVLPRVLDLAAAGGLDLAYASDLVTDAMAALGMETSQLDSYIDQMAKTSQKSNTSVAQLGEATLVCAGTVSLANQPLETMNAELGVLANNGIKGAEGGTHLRNVILSLVSPTDVGAKALKSLGVEVADSSGQIRNLNDIMVDMNNALSDMSAVEKSNVISTIFNKTDIAAVNALLKGTGDEFDNLYAQINSCDGAAKDMADTMSANLTGKLDNLESALEGLAITAYDKIEGTLKNSVDEANDSVNDLQMSLESGELGRAMDDFAEALDEAAAGAIDFAEDALPALIDGLTWVMDNSDLVIAGITGITSATVYHGTVAPMITTAMNAWKAYKAANEGATVAQWALNGAMNANPAGMLVTAIVGLTAALATYAVKTATAKTETELFAEEISESNQLIRDSVAERENAQKSEAAELVLIERMKNELLELNEQESLTNEEKTKMQMLVDQLNEALPELNLAIEEESGYLSQTNAELESYISNMEESLRLKFMQEDIEEVYRELYDAQTDLIKIEEEYNEYSMKSAELQKDWAAACEAGETAMREFNEELGQHATEAIAEYNQKMLDLEPSLNDSKNLVAELETEYEELKVKMEEAQSAQEEMQESTESLTKVEVEYQGKMHKVSSEVSGNIDTITESYQTAYNEAVKSIDGQIGLFEELSLESDMTARDMAKSLQSQVLVMTTYKNDMQIAAKLVEKGLMEEGLLGSIQALGVEGAAYLHELVLAAEEDTAAFVAIMNEWALMTEAKDNLADTMADIKEGYSETMDDLLEVQSDADDEMSDEADRLAKKITEAMDMEASTENFDKSMRKYESTVKEVSKETVKSVEEVKSAYQEAYEEADKTLSGQISLFDELSVTSEKSAQEMITALQSQTATIYTYQHDLLLATALAEQGLLDEGLLGAFKELGIDGAGYLHELVTTAQTDTQAFNSLMGEWALMSEAKESLTDTLATLEAGYTESMDSILLAQSDKNALITAEADALGKDIITSLTGTYDEALALALAGMDDMNVTLVAKAPELKATTQELCTASIDGANEALQIGEEGTSASFVAVGYSMPQGIAQGVLEGQDLIKDALQGAVDYAINSVDMSGITAKINRELGDLYE
ncbi:MAG: phage tail tape measure protein [Lachnospiraceae bacterium]|nr:phage tail tape measure protein [Lachnospiraceae bacterium]